jgi:hypothetical protein
MKKSLYPARVSAISLPSGSVIDGGHSVDMFDWTVRFGKVLPSAIYSVNPGGEAQLEIGPMTCSSVGTESNRCSIVIPRDRERCIFFPTEEPGDIHFMACPDSLELAK